MKTDFVFAASNPGFEKYCKAEFLEQFPEARFSYSRPGFLTFRLNRPDFSRINGLMLVRTSGRSLGKILVDDDQSCTLAAESLAEVVNSLGIRDVHFWNRSLGIGKPMPVCTVDDEPFRNRVLELLPSGKFSVNRYVRKNRNVLDLIQLEPGEIWYGTHRVDSPQQAWPGGVIRFPVPDRIISRAYCKTREAMVWSRFPFRPNDCCVEIGCAPGGSAQALLEQGLKVIGIDPAEVDPGLIQHPGFTHIRKRGSEVRKKLLADARWLFADSNVAPSHTLDTVEDIVSNKHTNLRGMILTLKLADPELLNEVSGYAGRIRGMGFQYVRPRLLASNRNEICVAALRKKSLLRFGKQKHRVSRSAN